MHKISGTFCAALTPVNADYSINKKLFLNHCNNLLNDGLTGLGIFGTTGEANSFSVQEKIDAISYLIDNQIKSDQLIIGTGLCSIKDSVLITKYAAKIKAKAVLVLPAFYYKNVSNEGVIDFYSKIVEGVSDNNLQYILYHYPALSGISLNFKIIEKLINIFPNNVVGMKDSSGDINNMLKTIKLFENFSVFSGSDSLAVKVCMHGGAGAITAASNISGKLLSFLVNNYKNKNEIKNFEIFQELQDQIREIVTSTELISLLKGFLSIEKQDNNWNRLIPPLRSIEKPENNKSIIALTECVKKMNNLFLNFKGN